MSLRLPEQSTAILSLSLLLTLHSITTWASAAPKLDCYPLAEASKEKCEAFDCIWSPVKSSDGQTKTSSGHVGLTFDGVLTTKLIGNLTEYSDIQEPWCYFPEDYVGYEVVGRIDGGGDRIKLRRVKPSALPNDIRELMLEVTDHGYMLRVKIYDAKKRRFEPELPELKLPNHPTSTGEQSQFQYEINQKHLIIRRKSTGAILFQTDLRKLIFSDKFIQLNSRLDSPFVFGLGEHFDTFVKMADDYKPYSFFNTDKVTLPKGRRSYGGFPFYINYDSEKQSHAHGVYLRNSDAMDIVLQPDQSITFRPIGGILDFILFSGPDPMSVISQYQHLVGLPDLPPRWALGFHLCRYNYGTLEKTKLVWKRTRDSGIPFDIQWNDIDNMDRHNDFTYDPKRFAGLPEFIEELHKNNMYYMLLFDPGLSQEDNYYPYSLGVQMDIFVKNATNQTLIGKVWNDSGRTVFPDFSNPKSIDYWSQLFSKFQKEIAFDGAWIDMNDISNFVYGSLDGCPQDEALEQPPYKPGGYDLQTNSLCLSAKHRAGYEYDLHNLYSFYEAIATYKALEAARPNKRPMVISRSTAPGQGHYGGHWSGDVLSTWDYLKWSIPSLIEHSMYGFNMMGTDICGFIGNTNPELCARWSTLGAFYTFSRNHNDDVSIDQDPVALGPDVVAANKNALTKKYSLLPYLYTLIHRANKYGEPAIRAIPFEFFTDKEAQKVEYQFMWGRGFMISPIVDPNTYTKNTYLPEGRWYESNVVPSNDSGYIKVPKWIDSKGEWYETKDVALSDIPIFYRGGFIFPYYQNVRQTIAETVKQPIGLRLALCPKNMAHGELYLDDGDNVDGKYSHMTMKFENNKLEIIQDHDDYSQAVAFGLVRVYGISSQINGIKVNDKTITFRRSDHVLSFDLDGAQVSKEQPKLTVELY